PRVRLGLRRLRTEPRQIQGLAQKVDAMRRTSGARVPNLSARMNKTNVEKLLKRLLDAKADAVKLGMDVHARDVVVCVQVDGARPQRPQRMCAEEVVMLVRALVESGLRVYCCYEAGPCGYELHRRLSAVGATNYVVAPQVLTE